MSIKNKATSLLAPALLAMTSAAYAGAPSFEPAIYADGEVFSTKGLTVLPAVNAHNRQSFDALYVITNSNNPQGQMPIGEAAPGATDFNGGRWFTHTVEWTAQAFMDLGIVPVLTSDDEIAYHEAMGHLVVTPGSFPNGPPVYFECPLLPTKQ